MDSGKLNWLFLIAAVVGLLLLLFLQLGLGASAAPDETPPVADAGPDQLIDQVRAAHLDASASTDDVGIDRYTWTFSHLGSPVALEGQHAYFLFEAHGVYEVTLAVSDAAGNTDDDTLLVTVLTPPGPVLNITAIPRNGWVELAWDPPPDDGGTNVTSSLLYRGTNPDALRPFSSDYYIEYWHWDPLVTNGLTYYYAVRAINAVGMGPLSRVVNATPMDVPTVPLNLTLRSSDGVVRLSWEASPEGFGRAPVTGYQVHRGTDPDLLYDTFEVGNATSWVDEDVEVGEVYYYAVGAESELGSSNITEVREIEVVDVEEGSWLAVVVLLVPLVGIFAALVWWAHQQAKD